MAKGGTREVCVIEGCNEQRKANQRCATHRAFYRRNGRDGGMSRCVHVGDNGERCIKKTKTFVGEESIARCSQHDVTYCRYRQCPNKTPRRSYQWCDRHYRQNNQGVELEPLSRTFGRRKPESMTHVQWFGQYIRITPERPLCWTFGSGNRYPNFSVDKYPHKAHRWSYEHFFDTKLQRGQEVDHTCRNTQCVNPSHLSMRADRAEHAAVETYRDRAVKEHNERTGQEATWGADPEAPTRTWSAFEFALQHRLPFKVGNMSREVPPKEAPIVINERQALAEALAERASWLEAQGETEDSYSTAG